jgi:hypothetical protein
VGVRGVNDEPEIILIDQEEGAWPKNTLSRLRDASSAALMRLVTPEQASAGATLAALQARAKAREEADAEIQDLRRQLAVARAQMRCKCADGPCPNCAASHSPCYYDGKPCAHCGAEPPADVLFIDKWDGWEDLA